MLKISQTASVMKAANVDAAKTGARIVAGTIINKRVAALIKPQLPMMVKGYADTALGEAVIANAVAAAIVHVAPGNEKAVLASQAMVEAAMVQFMASFNLEDKIDDLLKGVDIEALKAPKEA